MFGILFLSIGVAIAATLLLILFGAPLWAALLSYMVIGAVAVFIAGYWNARRSGWTAPKATSTKKQGQTPHES